MGGVDRGRNDNAKDMLQSARCGWSGGRGVADAVRSQCARVEGFNCGAAEWARECHCFPHSNRQRLVQRKPPTRGGKAAVHFQACNSSALSRRCHYLHGLVVGRAGGGWYLHITCAARRVPMCPCACFRTSPLLPRLSNKD